MSKKRKFKGYKSFDPYEVYNETGKWWVTVTLYKNGKKWGKWIIG